MTPDKIKEENKYLSKRKIFVDEIKRTIVNKLVFFAHGVSFKDNKLFANNSNVR
jgi:uncharacterized phage-associated protein